MYVVDLVDANVAMMVLVLVGGLCYTVGAVFYALKKPDHGIFGFHEIFHALTAAAYLCHWTAILLIAMAPVVS
jgi:hemolysin III